MKNELRFYRVYPSVVKSEKKTKIEISGVSEKYEFKEKEYLIRIVPKEKRDIAANENFIINKNEFDEITVEPKGGKVTFFHTFNDEQEYKLLFLEKNHEDDERFLEFSIYSLKEDLYGLLPFKGDLHLHSTGSDGKGEPYEVAGAYREKAYDFICLTDHHKYEPSQKLDSLYKDMHTGLKVFHGEEVHNCSMGYFHIVNFNGKYSVNTVLEADYENLKKRLYKEAEGIDVPDTINKREYVFRKWICDEIRKSGGKAIFPHPYWTYRDEYHTETQMSFYSLKQGLYDIYELIGGCSPEENNMQSAIYNELRADGIDIPVVGSTDAHDILSSQSSFDHACTLVFAKNEDEIPDRIMEKYSVAVETLPKEKPRVHGKFRFIKYGLFLMENFFPTYSLYTKDLGAFMRSYALYGDCVEAMKRTNDKAQEFRKKYFLGE